MTDDPTHQRLRRRKGSAKNFACVACGEPAYEWAYQHEGDPLDIDSYAPMCRSCHRKLDLRMSPVLQAAWEKSRAVLTREDRVAGGRASPHPGLPLSHEEAVALGRLGGTARASRMREDPELLARMTAVANDNRPRDRRQCSECGMVSTAPGLGNHHKASGHRGYKKG